MLLSSENFNDFLTHVKNQSPTDGLQNYLRLLTLSPIVLLLSHYSQNMDFLIFL